MDAPNANTRRDKVQRTAQTHAATEATHDRKDAHLMHHQHAAAQAHLPRLHPHPAPPAHAARPNDHAGGAEDAPWGHAFHGSALQGGGDQSIGRGGVGKGDGCAAVAPHVSIATATVGIEVAEAGGYPSSSCTNKAKAKRFLVGICSTALLCRPALSCFLEFLCVRTRYMLVPT